MSCSSPLLRRLGPSTKRRFSSPPDCRIVIVGGEVLPTKQSDDDVAVNGGWKSSRLLLLSRLLRHFSLRSSGRRPRHPYIPSRAVVRLARLGMSSIEVAPDSCRNHGDNHVGMANEVVARSYCPRHAFRACRQGCEYSPPLLARKRIASCTSSAPPDICNMSLIMTDMAISQQ